MKLDGITELKSKSKQSRKGDFTKEDNWIEYFEWLSKTAIQFQETFNKY